jgi:hypothetical protein
VFFVSERLGKLTTIKKSIEQFILLGNNIIMYNERFWLKQVNFVKSFYKENSEYF